MRNTYLQHHGPYNHGSKFNVPCRIKLVIWSFKDLKIIQKVFSIHAHEHEEHAEVDKLNDTNSQHGLQDNLLIVSGFANILWSETDDDLNTNVDQANSHHDHLAEESALCYDIEPLLA